MFDVLVCSVPHSGTMYTVEVIGGSYYGLISGEGDRFARLGVTHFTAEGRRQLRAAIARGKTVVPLRHPTLTALSFKERGKHRDFVGYWHRMHEVLEGLEPFFFPMERKPFDALERYLEAKVRRIERVVNSIGEYRYKVDWAEGRTGPVKNRLGKDYDRIMRLVQDSPIGQRFYGSSDEIRLRPA